MSFSWLLGNVQRHHGSWLSRHVLQQSQEVPTALNGVQLNIVTAPFRPVPRPSEPVVPSLETESDPEADGPGRLPVWDTDEAPDPIRPQATILYACSPPLSTLVNPPAVAEASLEASSTHDACIVHVLASSVYGILPAIQLQSRRGNPLP
ncbi:hypothetical protein MKX07_007017 [Trichoderma sp. CBMAI-0711]|uniref:Uncharacterized protein n=1 Tax=Trichoderma parareesei TaxID=858221 RepID=A0A2H3A2I3_TRIPA|nr:hypothetical protein MKX07_007017 [Trichoderma sp. CBMAI-0711]OTA05524.1 hypothetical protein A9Z42_0062170 [Trichoderma parareesei]